MSETAPRLSRDDLYRRSLAEVNTLADQHKIDPRTVLTGLRWLGAVLRDGQPLPDIGYDPNPPALDVAWIVGGDRACFSLFPGGVWEFWMDVGNGFERLTPDSTTGMDGDIMERVVAILDGIGTEAEEAV